MVTDKDHNKENDIKEDIIKDYNSIIRESALLTTVSGFLFGFLLNISINSPKGFDPLDSIVLMISLFAITLAVSLFAMPVVYHHLQYPYRDLEKFNHCLSALDTCCEERRFLAVVRLCYRLGLVNEHPYLAYFLG